MQGLLRLAEPVGDRCHHPDTLEDLRGFVADLVAAQDFERTLRGLCDAAQVGFGIAGELLGAVAGAGGVNPSIKKLKSEKELKEQVWITHLISVKSLM